MSIFCAVFMCFWKSSLYSLVKGPIWIRFSSSFRSWLPLSSRSFCILSVGLMRVGYFFFGFFFRGKNWFGYRSLSFRVF